jgi:hypothetical protein
MLTMYINQITAEQFHWAVVVLYNVCLDACSVILYIHAHEAGICIVVSNIGNVKVTL